MVSISTLQAIISAIVLLFVIAGTFTGAIAVATVGIVVGRIGVALLGIVSTFTAITSIAYASYRFKWDVSSFTNPFAIVVLFSIVPVVLFWFLSIYVGWRASIGDSKYESVRKIAIALAAIGGASFYNADLADAKFNQATLQNTDFRNANLTRTCFYKVKKLGLVRPGTSYLQYTNLRQVLATGQGQSKNFDRLDLRGVNFQGVNLSDASFIAADLSNASFQDADLSRAKLVQAQLDDTDFTGANLTGAYTEDWNITSQTNFTGVRCQYIYMRLPTKDNPDPWRKPDNREEVFADGEFGDFIKPIFDTLDLYHNQGVDPRAIAISFKQLAEKHPDAELRIVGIEARGEDKLLLRAGTATNIDKSELSAEYFDTYNQIKALPEKEVKLLLAEKDNRIRSLETMVNTALQSPKFYANNYNNQGDTMSQSPKKQSNFNLQGAQFAGGIVNAETVTAHQIGGNITNYTSEQKQNLAQAAADIQQLLNQLSQTYPTTTTSEKMLLMKLKITQR
jgi:uncharacterized protein YjbI with pentapeptide repeats